jgi:predicted nuclease of predicted toxin-antitoxin system
VILADENLDHSIIETIRDIGVEVYSIYELNRGFKDESIIELSRNPPRIILTEDKDFGEWVFAHHVTNISVLFIRYDFKDTELIKKAIVKLLSERKEELIGNFTTLTIHKIRIRKI